MTAADALAEAIDELGRSSLSARTVLGAPIGTLTTYRVGGSAAALVTVENVEELEALARLVARVDVPTLVIGRGSNLLVADSGFAGIAVVLGDGFTDVDIERTTVWAGGAAKLPVVARTTVHHGLTGFEWAVGVPGSIGGAVRMNAGGHGAEMVDTLVRVGLVDLRSGVASTREAVDLALGYRSSSISESEVVVVAELELQRGDREAGRERMAEIVQWRRTNQPGGQNAGSVFTNPPGDSAGRMIDAAGAKGLRIGTAEVSTRHANFIQADEGGSAGDIIAVMAEVRRRVREVHGIALRAETRLIGFDAATLAPLSDESRGEGP